MLRPKSPVCCVLCVCPILSQFVIIINIRLTINEIFCRLWHFQFFPIQPSFFIIPTMPSILRRATEKKNKKEESNDKSSSFCCMRMTSRSAQGSFVFILHLRKCNSFTWSHGFGPWMSRERMAANVIWYMQSQSEQYIYGPVWL